MTMTSILSVPVKKFRLAEELILADSSEKLDEFCESTGIAFDEASLDQLLDLALKRHPDRSERSSLDSFLAPRIHMILRMPRATAARPGVWAWCAARPLARYMARRWPLDEESSLWRYTSRDVLRNGISRLWWAAEMLRSGPDYTVVPLALKSVRRFQFVSELRYSMHRECARAFARVLDDRSAGDDQAQQLSKRLNVYLRAIALELWDYSDSDSIGDIDTAWGPAKPTLQDLASPTAELVGPQRGYARSDVEEHLYGWLMKISEEAE